MGVLRNAGAIAGEQLESAHGIAKIESSEQSRIAKLRETAIDGRLIESELGETLDHFSMSQRELLASQDSAQLRRAILHCGAGGVSHGPGPISLDYSDLF